MGNGIDLETFDIKRFAESIVKDCQEGVKWEIRKLEWIREEEKRQAESTGNTKSSTCPIDAHPTSKD